MNTRYLVAAVAAATLSACTNRDLVSDIPLRVVATAPSGGAVGVAREAAITLTFSERLVAESAQAGVTLETVGTPAVPAGAEKVEASVTYSDEPVPTVTLVPAQKLPFSARLRVTVATTVLRARDRGPLPVPVSWTFDTANPPPLRVLAFAPGDGATGVPRSAALSVLFSEPVDCASLSANANVTEKVDPHPHTAEGTGTVTIAGSWDCTGADATSAAVLDGNACDASTSPCTVTFKPADAAFRFRFSSSVTLALKGGSAADAPVQSARATPLGGQLAQAVQSSFRVEDPPPLALVSAAPADGASGVAKDTAVTFTFSEPIECPRLLVPGAATAAQVVDAHPRFGGRAGATEAVNGTWSCPSVPAGTPEGAAACAASPALCRAVFQPASKLEDSSLLRMTLKGGPYAAGPLPAALDRVESLRATTAGGQLQASVTSAVRAVTPAALSLVASSPGDGAGNVPVSPPPTVELAFSREVRCASALAGSTVHATVTPPGGAPVDWPFTLECNAGDSFFRLVPQSSTPLPWSATVEVTLDGGAFSAGTPGVEAADATTLGGQLPQDATVTFHTQDPPALLLTASAPPGGAQDAGWSSPLEFTFSEPVDCASISAASVIVHEAPAPRASGAGAPAPADVACTFTCPADGDAHKVRCDHAPFGASSEVTVTLSGGTGLPTAIRSTEATATGGQLPSTLQYSFRAGPPAPLAVVGTVPNGNPGINVSANTDVRFTFSRAVHCASAVGKITLVRESSGAAVPGTLTCTNGTSVGPGVDGTVVIFTPSAPLAVQARYRATALSGIQPADATLVGGMPQGALPSSVAVEFDVAFEDIRILGTTPAAGAQLAPIGSNVVLQFNQELNPSSLVACTPSSDKAACNVVVTRASAPFN